jgi:hypothetical protein
VPVCLFAQSTCQSQRGAPFDCRKRQDPIQPFPLLAKNIAFKILLSCFWLWRVRV